MNQVPWNRIVHFYGRATEVPAAIEDLATERHAAAEKMLLHNLEHQDGVIQATPIAVNFIVQALREGRVRDRAAVEDLLARILASARFQLEGQGRPAKRPTLDTVLAAPNLWPEDEGDDEVRWEEWSEGDVDFSAWAALTEELITNAGIGAAATSSPTESPSRDQTQRKPWWRFW
jgi:hypothetical protein